MEKYWQSSIEDIYLSKDDNMTALFECAGCQGRMIISKIRMKTVIRNSKLRVNATVLSLPFLIWRFVCP